MQPRMIAVVFPLCALFTLAAAIEVVAQRPESRPEITGRRLIEFDAPGSATESSPACAPSCGTVAYANNDFGDVVGSYTDFHVVPHGFLRTRSGVIISFDAPGAGLGFGLNEGTVAYSINDLGVIAGQFQDPNLVFHGFVRDADGTFTTFDAPGAGTAAFEGTLGTSISQEGVVSGFTIDGNSVYHGFVRDQKGTITTFDAPGAGMTANAPPQGTFPCLETCINSSGAITGFYYDANYGVHGFVRQPDGEITTFNEPRAGSGAFEGTVNGSINGGGTIAGYFADANSMVHGFVSTPEGNFITFDVPAASQNPGEGTAGFSINGSGVVTGEFNDAQSVMHGFSRSASGIFATFNAPGAGRSAGQGTRPSTNNAGGEVTGWWIDENNVNHGFIWIP